MNRLQSGPPTHGQILTLAEMKLRAFFFSNNFNLRSCAGVTATSGTRRAHNCKPMKDILLLADSNFFTWAPSIPCCLLLRPPVSRLGILQDFRIIIRRSKCADTGTNDSGIHQRSLRSVEPVCFPASHRALSHMKPRQSLAATFLAKSKTLPEGSADLEISHQANGRGILPSGRGVIFQ